MSMLGLPTIVVFVLQMEFSNGMEGSGAISTLLDAKLARSSDFKFLLMSFCPGIHIKHTECDLNSFSAE